MGEHRRELLLAEAGHRTGGHHNGVRSARDTISSGLICLDENNPGSTGRRTQQTRRMGVFTTARPQSAGRHPQSTQHRDQCHHSAGAGRHDDQMSRPAQVIEGQQHIQAVLYGRQCVGGDDLDEQTEPGNKPGAQCQHHSADPHSHRQTRT